MSAIITFDTPNAEEEAESRGYGRYKDLRVYMLGTASLEAISGAEKQGAVIDGSNFDPVSQLCSLCH